MRRISITLALLLLPLAAPAADRGEAGTPRKVFWDALMPPGWMPPESNIDHFFDNPQSQTLSLLQAPVVQEMNGQYVSLPGYLVPVQTVGEDFKEFLVVPYFGACIHTPPPPPNQIVLVTVDKPLRVKDPYSAYWITGVLSTQAATTTLAEAGYTMRGERIELFDWEAANPQPDP